MFQELCHGLPDQQAVAAGDRMHEELRESCFDPVEADTCDPPADRI